MLNMSWIQRHGLRLSRKGWDHPDRAGVLDSKREFCSRTEHRKLGATAQLDPRGHVTHEPQSRRKVAI